MGNSINKNSKQLNLHTVIFQWQDDEFIDLKADDKKFKQGDYLITENGNIEFDLEKEDLKFVKNQFQKNIDKEKAIMQFDVNFFNGHHKTPKAEVCNGSYYKDKNQYIIWELINFKRKNIQKVGIKIKEGQSFKLGGQIMKLKTFVSKKMTKRSSKIFVDEKKTNEQYYSLRDLRELDSIRDLPEIIEKDLTCRICLEKETKTNRFHNFCGCKKTMPTHLNCLQLWLKKNAQFNENNGIHYFNFLDIECDICKTQFPSTYISKEGVEKPLIKPDIPDNIPYVLLDIYKIKDPTVMKSVMVIELKNDKLLSLGRDGDCDIRFAHPCISRKHCSFKINQKGFYLIDHDSKFGTYVQIEHKNIKKYEETILQVGKCLIEIHPFKSKPCQCIQLRDYTQLQTNPFQEIKEVRAQNEQQKVLVSSRRSHPQLLSFNKLHQNKNELKQPLRQHNSDETQHTKTSNEKQVNNEPQQSQNLVQKNLSNIIKNKYEQNSFGFRSILMKNTDHKNKHGNLRQSNQVLTTHNEISSQEDFELYDGISFNRQLSQSYRFDQQQLNKL